MEHSEGPLPGEPLPVSGDRAWAGHSLIELMIVLTLLGMVCATVIPRLLEASAGAQQKAVLDDLHMFRRQIEQFRTDHAGLLPAQGTNSEAALIAQLTHRTTSAGQVDARGPHGPYLLGDLPSNPYTHSSTVLVVPGPLLEHHFNNPTGHGWAYSSTTGEFRACAGDTVIDPSGRRVNSL